MIPKTKIDARDSLFLIIAFAVLAACFFLFFRSLEAVADEPAHIRAVSWIAQGLDFFPRGLPCLPGYHYTVAALYWITHFRPPAPAEFLPLCPPAALYFFPTTIRLLSTFLSFICLVSFLMLSKAIDKSAAIRQSLLFLFSPLFFPFFFLIYTDTCSMLYILLSLLFALKKRLWISGLFGILSLFVRQNNILWVAFIAGVAYFESYYPEWRWKDVKRWLSKFSVFFLAAMLLAAFLFWNKGPILDDKSHHALSLRLDNLFYLLFCFFFLFLPYNLSKAGEVLLFVKKYKLTGLLLIEVFLLYFFFFNPTHIYNSTEGVFRLFLHNHVTALMKTPGLLHRILTFSPIAFSILSLCVTRLERKSFYMLYPFTILFLLPNEVIEVRYLFIPLALFLAFKEKDSWKITGITMALYWITIGCLMRALALRFFI